MLKHPQQFPSKSVSIVLSLSVGICKFDQVFYNSTERQNQCFPEKKKNEVQLILSLL